MVLVFAIWSFAPMKKSNLRELIDKRKRLRNFSTSAESTLWNYLRDGKLAGRKFRRQHGMGYYILDFYCPSEKLCVELDGRQHYTESGKFKDKQRTRYLNSVGITVVRFENKRVFEDVNFVLEKIQDYFK